MQQRELPAIVLSPYMHLAKALDQTDITHVVSILGQTDKLQWPDVGSRRVLRLQFDDTAYSLYCTRISGHKVGVKRLA